MLISFILLTACGFHLRGQSELPVELKTLYLQSPNPYSPMTKQLKQTLQHLGINLVNSPNLAQLTLQIIRDQLNQSESIVGANTQVREFYLTYILGYQLIDQEGELVVPQQFVSATRNFTADTNRSLGTSNERKTLEQEMHRDVIFQLLNRLNSKTTRKILEPIPPKKAA